MDISRIDIKGSFTADIFITVKDMSNTEHKYALISDFGIKSNVATPRGHKILLYLIDGSMDEEVACFNAKTNAKLIARAMREIEKHLTEKINTNESSNNTGE